MKANRRNFIKQTVLGSAGLSAGIGLTMGSGISENSLTAGLKPGKINPPDTSWEITLDEQPALLTVKNGPWGAGASAYMETEGILAVRLNSKKTGDYPFIIKF